MISYLSCLHPVSEPARRSSALAVGSMVTGEATQRAKLLKELGMLVLRQNFERKLLTVLEKGQRGVRMSAGSLAKVVMVFATLFVTQENASLVKIASSSMCRRRR